MIVGLRAYIAYRLFVVSQREPRKSDPNRIDMFPLPRGVVVLLSISGIALLIILFSDLLVPPSPEDRMRVLRAELAHLRVAADSCRTALDGEEEELVARDKRLDSLRRQIEHFEALDPRGVPVDSYDIYLANFNAYNEGIPERTVEAETLQAHWRECRSMAERHNERADSARSLAIELGLVPDSTETEAGS